MRRFRRAAAFGTTAAAEPTTGGQSMPRMVTAGRAHNMSDTLPSPSRDTPSSTPASLRNCSGGYGAPVHVRVLSSPAIVVLPWSSRRVASVATRAASASGAAPPNIPEWISETPASMVTTTLTMPRRLTVAAGWPTAALPVSQTRIVSARSRSALATTKASRPPVPCSSDPSTTSLRLTGTASPRARSAARCMTMLPLQSAAPRPYQRPSTSVSSNGGVRQASSSRGGCTS